MVGEEDIVKSVDQSQNKILQNLWFLCEKGYIEREGYIGGNAVYQITDRGRRYLE
jgi:DNA-binding PadR family transcriptional regulator